MLTAKELLGRAQALEPQLVEWRRTLHRHPEVGRHNVTYNFGKPKPRMPASSEDLTQPFCRCGCKAQK